MRSAAIVEEVGGYTRELAVIRFRKDAESRWSIEAPAVYMPSETELVQIQGELVAADWPVWSAVYNQFDKEQLPTRFAKLPDECFFVFHSPRRDVDGLSELANQKVRNGFGHSIIMIQVRIETQNGSKAYKPFTYWEGLGWLETEPDRLLPVYGMERLLTTGKRVAFLHEGAKAARHAQSIADAYEKKTDDRTAYERTLAEHPWAHELAGGVHLGWIGGACRVGGTDWLELKKACLSGGIERVIVVADNDKIGREALPEISRHLGMPADHLIFPSSFPVSFDMADDFPAEAPTMQECLRPGTWMTRLVQNKKGKPTVVLTEAGSGEWTFIPDVPLYVNYRFPWIAYDKERLNAVLRPLCDTPNIAGLIEKDAYASGRPMRLTYDPGKPPGVVADGEGAALNIHRPPNIVSMKGGGAALWLEFLDYLFPEPADRQEVAKWCATLIGRPDVKMTYSLLLISETQGVGKSTLGNILAELVGRSNASFPSQSEIGADFNEWQAAKRLAVINEVYAGHSWAGYNALKSAVTDETLSINRKYQRVFTVRNWLHILANSNSVRALKLDLGDRRWFVPKVTEKKWPRAKFEALLGWLKNDGGLREILHWAKSYEDYVLQGAEAPASKKKHEVIEASRSDAANAMVRLAQVMTSSEYPISVTVRSARQYAGRVARARVNEDDQEMIRILKSEGLIRFGRVKVGGVLETILVNPEGGSKLPSEEPHGRDLVRKWIKEPIDLMPFDDRS